MMVKNQELMLDYSPLPNPLHFSDTNGKSLTAYGTGTARIRMQHMDILVKEVYYISIMIANLFYNHDFFIFNYWIKLLQDFSWKVIE